MQLKAAGRELNYARMYDRYAKLWPLNIKRQAVKMSGYCTWQKYSEHRAFSRGIHQFQLTAVALDQLRRNPSPVPPRLAPP